MSKCETKRSASGPAAKEPCKDCPWRTANHGKPHPGGWFTKRNRARLWAGLRRGEIMSCHRTDPDNPVPDGVEPVPAGTTTLECAGGLVLQQREFMTFQAIGSIEKYRKARPRGMTRDGFRRMLERVTFGILAGPPMAKPNLDQPGISHDGLSWDPSVCRNLEG